jgi:adenylate cyclase
MNVLRNFFKTLWQGKYATFIVALLVGHLVFVSVLGLRSAGILQILELSAYDFLLWTRSISSSFDSRITIIWATDEDQRQLGWPLADDKLAQLFQTILAYEPDSIGLDIYRDLPVPLEGGAGYDALADILKKHNNIFAIRKLVDSKGSRVDPPPALIDTDRVGFNDIPEDAGGIIRRGLLYASDMQQNVHELFGLKLVMHYLKRYNIEPQGVPDNPNALGLGKAVLEPLDENFGGYVAQDAGGFQIMLTYPGAPTEFNSLSLNRVLEHQFEPEWFRNRIKGRIVLIGVNAQATPDFVYTPFGYSSKVEQRLPGVAVHAYIISQLLRMSLDGNKPLYSLTEFQENLWIWLWSVVSALVCLWARSVWRVTLSVLGGLLTLVIGSQLAFSYDLWIIIAAPAIGWTISNSLMISYLANQDKNQRAELMQIFSKHVSKNVAEAIWKEREHYLNAGRLRPQRLIATVLFTDLQNFTTVSERMEPQSLMDWLNQYMETMVNVIEKKHSGHVNKFIGDAIMALFGVPISRQSPNEIFEDAARAVDCALQLRDEMERLREVWEKEGLPLIRMRVGICTGPVVAGSLGAVERQEYTVLGDTVNTASRLESFDKNIDAESACRILISETTLECLDGQFATECVGSVYLKGKESRVTIYRVIGRKLLQQ